MMIKNQDIIQRSNLVDNLSHALVNDIIEGWRYHGETLTQEKIAFDEFVNIGLKKFGHAARKI